MGKKKTILVLVLILLLMGGAGAAAAMYLKADRQPPELTLRTDVTVEFGQSLSMYELIDRVNDESSFSLSVSAPQGSVSADGKSISFPSVGSFQVELTASDEHGNAVTQDTTVEVVDTTPPVLQAEEFTIYVDKDLAYQGHVSATDAADGDLTESIKVSAGKVKLSEPGRYPITYSVTDRSGNSASVTSYVTVVYPPAKKITLSETEVWLAGNEYVQLKAKVKPSDWHGEVEWSSSDPEVAEVSDGLVVWKSEGECVITARAGEKEAQCSVHCESPRPTDVRLNKYTLNLAQNESFTLTAEVLPSNWSGTVEWWSSDPSVAGVDENGTVTWVGGGSCTITASAEECFAQCEVECARRSIQDFLDDLLGLNDDEQDNGQEHEDSAEPPSDE